MLREHNGKMGRTQWKNGVKTREKWGGNSRKVVENP